MNRDVYLPGYSVSNTIKTAIRLFQPHKPPVFVVIN